MRLVAFVEGRPKPQPRVTKKSSFLFSKTVEQWGVVDADNAKKASEGLINKKGNPFKETRYAYRLARLQGINAYRLKVQETVSKACGGAIPEQFLFIFYLFYAPASWSRKKQKAHEWLLHEKKPDYSNLLKGIEDAMYKKDSVCNAVANYKLCVPRDIPEGLLILRDEEIHRFVIETAIEGFLKKMV